MDTNPIFVLVGARPNFIKLAPLLRAFRAIDQPIIVVHTGQHYDDRMSEAFFRVLNIPKPDMHLGITAKSRIGQLGEIITKLEHVFTRHRPRALCVIGDVTSTLAGAAAAASADIPIAHIEAGLRSLDRTMPEEINRVMTDSVTEWFFVSETAGVEHLRREGQAESKIHLVGDLIVDAMREQEPAARSMQVWKRWGLTQGRYAAVTLHRPANVDDPRAMAECLDILSLVAERMPLILPLHPRTRKRLEEHGLAARLAALPGLHLCESLDYLEFLSLLCGAGLVLSDSGGIQLEATLLNLPCLTLRDTTERPLTVSHGTNTLVARDAGLVRRALEDILQGRYKKANLPAYWDGQTAGRIAQVLAP
jgi:UDP-N-acetylglucosamine 2-epimerase (non-hydrolysing)